MSIEFAVTDERIVRGRKPKPVSDAVTGAIDAALRSKQTVAAIGTSEDAEAFVRDYRRYMRGHPELKGTCVARDAGKGKVKILLEVSAVKPVVAK